MAGLDSTIAIVIVAIVGPLLTYLIAARKINGQVQTSDATELWAESRSIREWSSGRVEDLDIHITRLERRITEIELVNSGLSRDKKQLHRDLLQVRNTVHQLQGQAVSLTQLLERERLTVVQLQLKANRKGG